MTHLISQKRQLTRVRDDVVEVRLRALTHDLIERIKELNCLYGISRLVENEDLSLDEVLQGVVDIMPPAWQYPEVTCACIKLKTKQFQTRNFKETEWLQAEDIVVNGKHVGSVAVYYLHEEPLAAEGPFLKEERDLIHGIAERLGHIIESRHAETALQKSYLREKRLSRKLQDEMQKRVDFTRQLVHELKTPLTSLMATSQLLTEETRGTRLEKLAGYVWEGANSLNLRIDELHDVIRGEIGKLKIEPKTLDMARLLRSIIEETRALSRQHGVSIRLDLPAKTLPEVFADEERVRQIIFNLINNAFKYAAGGKEIIIKAAVLRGLVQIEVQDKGPGMSSVKRRNIFKPGYQSPDRDEKGGGLGIGLPLCKMLVELHGGKMWVESSIGKGSSFFFTLPLSQGRLSA